VVSETCNPSSTAAALMACAGAAGPPACPYCFESSCYRPGLCSAPTDCHAGDGCAGGVCRPLAPACPTTVDAAEVLGGGFAAGRELCVRDNVSDLFTSGDGDVVFHLGAAPGLAGTITPLYQAAGVAKPQVGATITVHGVVRWDEQRTRWELLPVDDWM
jgi:hypothetical protein